MNGVAAELKRSSAGPATPSTANSILEWDPLARDAFELAGFHPIEQRGGTYFRWSEPIAMVGVSLPAGRYEVSIEFLEGRFAAKRLELFHNRHHLPAQDISRELGRITAAIDMAQSGYSRLAWACRRFHAPRDSRWLGVPVTKITWRPVPG
jgi:hypothetical protein